jgi:hypothetical protein
MLETDSGWQMMINRAREILNLTKDTVIDIMGPDTQCLTNYRDINPDLWEKWEGTRLNYVAVPVIPNALVTRYDFQFSKLQSALSLSEKRYDIVYINDPMQFRNYKTLFYLNKQSPRFVVHSHFVDVPSVPKFPTETSLWLGQCEAAIRADFNFWQCDSALKEFEIEARKVFTKEIVDSIIAKSKPWDDGYSVTESNAAPLLSEISFDVEKEFHEATRDKVVLFVPNRIGGKGRSSDYTNCGKFMFEVLPELWKRRQDFVVIAGNPNQKFSNKELHSECGKHGYLKLTDRAFSRDEYKFIARNSDIVVALYTEDTFGGTASRECIDLGCLPLWVDVNEYSMLSKETKYPYLVKKDLSNLADIASVLIEHCKFYSKDTRVSCGYNLHLRNAVRKHSSYEATTSAALPDFFGDTQNIL